MSSSIIRLNKEVDSASIPADVRMSLRQELKGYKAQFDDWEKKKKAGELKGAVVAVKEHQMKSPGAPFYVLTLDCGTNAK
eukprot:Awhi_evm1s7380